MGEVYRATDTSLGRDVALKVLPPNVARDPERIARFQREAKALAALDHPGIVTVYSVEEAPAAQGTVHFLTMQLIDGQSLDRALPGEGFASSRVLEIAIRIADALAVAHEKGIVHRDLKLANVMTTTDSGIKILDFGLAKDVRATDADDETKTSAGATAFGVVMGTPAYMSPEQVEGKPVQASTDIFSLGVVLFELVTGRRPFGGDTAVALASSILRDTPPRASGMKTGPSAALDSLIAECLEKNGEQRPTAKAVADRLRQMQQAATAPSRSAWRNPRVIVPVAIMILAVVATLAWSSITKSRRAVFVAESLPRIESLARDGKYIEAFDLASRVDRETGAATVSKDLWELLSIPVSVVSEPAGAAITFRPFGKPDDVTAFGVTPLSNVRAPRGALHWRAELAGHRPADLVTGSNSALRFELMPANSPDTGMIRIPAGPLRLWAISGVRANPAVTIGAFLIDRHEVTNKEFAAFLAAGGYSKEELWKQPFVEDARTLTFREAMARFVDTTGRPGPATWKVGAYPDGEDDLPVGGVSWYEAAAYAAFAGKELPTVYHWYLADTANDIQLLPGLVLSGANHEGSGPRAAARGSMSAYGAVDMAGNVREWSASGSDHGTRITLGGAWTDPAYQYLFPDPRSPFDRSPGNGLRTMKRVVTSATAEETPTIAAALPALPVLDPRTRRPVSDAEFAVFARFFERKPVPLDPRIESTDESSKVWIKHRVSFAAGYGNERMTALLYLPRDTRPPYQVVVTMAGAATFYRKSSATEQDIFGWSFCEYLLRGGRAVMVPIWKGAYERSDGFHPLQTEWPSYREHVMQWVSELRQSINYLQSRDDVAGEKIAYQGISNGAIWAPIFLALEPRLKVGLLPLGGLLVIPLHETPMPPEIDGLHYAPRVTQPVLMMNGRNDAIFPYETSQVPLFKLFGTPAQNKQHLTFPGGHSSFGWQNELIKESLNWLDRWFGAVGFQPSR
jgi:serine/threonine protein kinase/formylglycine-generating enzyme required for sulfatase activity/cephalosporin-C deacetylase-like acetyl esterase